MRLAPSPQIGGASRTATHAGPGTLANRKGTPQQPPQLSEPAFETWKHRPKDGRLKWKLRLGFEIESGRWRTMATTTLTPTSAVSTDSPKLLKKASMSEVKSPTMPGQTSFGCSMLQIDRRTVFSLLLTSVQSTSRTCSRNNAIKLLRSTLACSGRFGRRTMSVGRYTRRGVVCG